MNAPSRPRFSDRTYDVVLFGATGFTGRLVAEELLRRYGAGDALRWALAGRSRDKLARVRDELAAIAPRAADLPLLVADAHDPVALAKVAGEARVVATTVGPYARYGRELVAACVEQGTSYADLTGEPHFVREMIDRHHARARETGARIVHCCGYDSIPSDLGTLVVQDAMRARHGVRCAEVRCYACESRGGLSGGTAATMVDLMELGARDRAARRLLADPYALDPDRAGQKGPDTTDVLGVRFDPDLSRWTGPGPMAVINAKIVRRSNALLGYAWGRDFRYREGSSLARGPRGLALAAGLAGGLGAMTALGALAPVRKLLAERVLPKPGEGPSADVRARGFFVVRLVGVGEGGAPAKLLGTVRAQGDPGYGATAVMLAASAVCLARDPLTSEGGVLTPASSMGAHLVSRLRDAGMVFDAEPLPARD